MRYYINAKKITDEMIIKGISFYKLSRLSNVSKDTVSTWIKKGFAGSEEKLLNVLNALNLEYEEIVIKIEEEDNRFKNVESNFESENFEEIIYSDDLDLSDLYYKHAGETFFKNKIKKYSDTVLTEFTIRHYARQGKITFYKKK